MPSILPDFEYDIFISYRQKDNKGDHWVTDFVTALRTELEATFKEDIHIYFDENPHDGLHDSHDVDDSLKEKIKCLLFIPIISRTYCDPNSFAWQKEFLPFLEFAKNDKHGLKIKLPNGNVASRVLPVRIHALDNSDVTLFEQEVGGVMRGIDFVYQEAGVNRPLRTEDNRELNLSKNDYRNQINKLSGAIREIFTSVMQENIPPNTLNAEKLSTYSSQENKPNRKRVITWITMLTMFMLSLAYFKPWNYFSSSPPVVLSNKSIAVLAFRDMTAAQDLEYLGDGIAEEIIDDLTKLVGLKVSGRTSSFSYKGKNVDLITIGKELGVQYVLEGSIRQNDSIVRVVAQLIDSSDGSHVWSYSQDREFRNTFALQDQIASEIAELFNETRNQSRMPELTPEVQNLYLLARYYGDRFRSQSKDNFLLAQNYYNKVIELAPDFSKAHSGLAYMNGLAGYFGYEFVDNKTVWNEARAQSTNAIKYDTTNSEGYLALAYVKRTHDWDWEGARALYQKAISIDPNDSRINYYYGLLLACVNEADSGLYYTKKAYGIDPLEPEIQEGIIRMYFFSGHFDEGIRFIRNNGLNDEIAKLYLCRFLFFTKQYDQYIEAIKSLKLKTEPPFDVYKQSGIEAFQQEWFRQKGDMILGIYSFLLYGGVTDQKELLLELNNAIDSKQAGSLIYLLIDPEWDPWQSDPRFDDLLTKLGLDVYKK